MEALDHILLLQRRATLAAKAHIRVHFLLILIDMVEVAYNKKI